jgi:hypothetical protein
MNFWSWGGKTLYYSLINKQGSKAQDEAEAPLLPSQIEFEDEDCEACKL